MSRVINIINSHAGLGWTADVEEIVIDDISSDIEHEGGFGILYNCLSIDNIPQRVPMLIKILKGNNNNQAEAGYQTCLKLLDKLSVYFKNRGYSSLPPEAVALQAVPKLCFTGYLDGEFVRGYSTINLIPIGFVSLEDIIEDTSGLQSQYYELPAEIKFRFCYHLCKAFDILSSINYVHADINPKNLFVNISTGELAIIDFDGGYIADDPNAHSLTTGKKIDGEWIAPEADSFFAGSKGAANTLNSDRWSVGIGIHFLIFLFGPFFFIKQHTVECKTAYLRNNPLYPVNLGDENCNNSRAAYCLREYESLLQGSIPEDLHKELIRTHSVGFFEPAERCSYRQWMEILGKTQEQPEISLFRPEKDFILKGLPVLLKWVVKGAVNVFIDNGIGNVAPSGQVFVKPDEDCVYKITAIGLYGSCSRETSVAVSPVTFTGKVNIEIPDFGKMPEFHLEQISFPFIQHSFAFPVIDLVELSVPRIELDKGMLPKPPAFEQFSSFDTITSVFNSIKAQII